MGSTTGMKCVLIENWYCQGCKAQYLKPNQIMIWHSTFGNEDYYYNSNNYIHKGCGGSVTVRREHKFYADKNLQSSDKLMETE